MDRDEALKLLRGGDEGVGEWNRRRSAGEPIPDLSKSDISRADLSRANLSGDDLIAAQFDGADLSGANLCAAELIGTDLSGANLRAAELIGANLMQSNLRGAKLIEANLNGADLREADLFAAELILADLSRANLSRANLSMANLSGANLRAAELIGANLMRSNLRGAKLIEANLNGADLREADLFAAELIGANLYRADFDNACLNLADLSFAGCWQTRFGNIDLSSTNGLNAAFHGGPSTIGINTLLLSNGKIPEAFLRGCGVPDAWIVSLPALIGSIQPIQFYSCFISYSTKDEEFAKRLHSRMRDAGLRVWFAPEEMQGGKKLHEQVDRAIQVHDRLLLILSEHSMESKWVKDEIRRARKAEIREGRRKLFPIKLVTYETLVKWESFYADLKEDLAEVIREYFIPDFSNWKAHDSFEAAFSRLLNDLKVEDSAGAKPA
jgi:uncharacterized protein YjbI with pentapeptide repeats